MGVALLITNLVYNTGLALVKLSVLLFYIRIFRIVSSYRTAFWAVGAAIVGSGIAINFLALFTCSQVPNAWNLTVDGRCLDTQQTFAATAIANLLIDFLLLVLPMPMLWQLHINTSRKCALIGVFAAGYR